MITMPNHQTKTNETKPRLGKDEVEILEREFKKNSKPTTQTKRQFADNMGVELARINVCQELLSSKRFYLTDGFLELVPKSTCQAKAGEEAGSL